MKEIKVFEVSKIYRPWWTWDDKGRLGTDPTIYEN